MGKDIPNYVTNMVQGLGYYTPPAVTSDACGTKGADLFEVLGAPASMPAPCEVLDTATKQTDAPTNPWRWNSGTKGGEDCEDWMEGPSLI